MYPLLYEQGHGTSQEDEHVAEQYAVRRGYSEGGGDFVFLKRRNYTTSPHH